MKQQVQWVRYQYGGQTGFGTLEKGTITVYTGHLFKQPEKTRTTIALADVILLSPCQPGKFLGLWNNFHQRAATENLDKPKHPLYFCKTSNSYLNPEESIVRPAHYNGDIAFEAELGIVIGKTCHQTSADKADEYIFGYTCVNDVTARTILWEDTSFPQWTRAKGFDTFTPFGPCIATNLEVGQLRVSAILNGIEKQNYPVSDMFYSPQQIVHLLSCDMTLEAGDIIACGTSVGAEAMPANAVIEVVIEGIGHLRNTLK